MSGQNQRQEYLNEIIKLLTLIRNKINDQTDVCWTYFATPADLIDDIEADIAKLSVGDESSLDEVHLKFIATGAFQEVSMADGWSKEYLKIAADYDRLEEKLNAMQPARNDTSDQFLRVSEHKPVTLIEKLKRLLRDTFRQ